MESPQGEKKWVDTFGVYDLLNVGWRIISSSHESYITEEDIKRIQDYADSMETDKLNIKHIVGEGDVIDD